MYFSKEPYLLQTEEWSKFWIEANEEGHEVFYIEKDFEDYKIKSYVYKYPYFLGQSFGYLSKGPVLEFKDKSLVQTPNLVANLKVFFKEVENVCKKEKLCFLKLDFDDNLTKILCLENNLDLLDFLRKEKVFKAKSLTLSKKNLQYLETPVLDLSILEFKISYSFDFENINNLAIFFEKNNEFWSRVNQNVRRYTRKSLKQNWKIDTQKTSENFEKFWQVFSETTKRQGFSPHPKKYLKTFFEADFSRIIVLSDEAGNPESVWLGAVDSNSRTTFYLYGGNTEGSFKKHGQYLVHLAVVGLASKEDLGYYDLGGYSEKEGYGKFKLNYKGEMRKWLGSVDLIFKPIEFNFIQILIFLLKFVRLKK